MKKIFSILLICFVICVLGGINIYQAVNWQYVNNQLETKYNELVDQYKTLYKKNQDNQNNFQTEQEQLMLLSTWAEADGYKDDIDGWWAAMEECRKGYVNADEKFSETDAINYATDEQKEQINTLVDNINKTRSLTELRTLTSNFIELTETINQQKNLQNIGETKITLDAYDWNVDNYVDLTYTEQDINDMSIDEMVSNSSGLNKSSGVNNYNGRTETYYSSNVLYHYKTPEWTLDSEGYYHDSNGYYVVAASDMEEGTVFEGSKGQCIVLDSGCAPGVTDYYVAW